MVAALLVLPACDIFGLGQVVVKDGVAEGTGALTYQNMEGNFYAIILGDDGIRYYPTADSDRAALDNYLHLINEHPGGIRVEFRGTIDQENGSIFASRVTTLHLTCIRPALPAIPPQCLQ